MKYLHLADDFFLPPEIDLSILDTIPVVVHKYGDPQPNLDSFYWMTYSNEGNVIGEIGFARKCGTFFPEVATYVVNYLKGLTGINLDPARVSFMRTRGNILPHTDEARACCINIGIRDTESARTSFPKNNTSIVMKPGSVYLIDTSSCHEVLELVPKERLLISCGFGVHFSKIQEAILNFNERKVKTNE